MVDKARSRHRAPEEGFTVREAAQRTGISVHTVRYYGGRWGRDGYGRFIKPEIADPGQGSAKLFSTRNLVQLRVAFLMREAGLPEAETRDLLSARGAGGKDWWDPHSPLGRDAVLLVRGAPVSAAVDRWCLCTPDLRIEPPQSWAAAVLRAAGPTCELLHVRFQTGWRPRFPDDSKVCWVLNGTTEAWVVNIGLIRRAVNE